MQTTTTSVDKGINKMNYAADDLKESAQRIKTDAGDAAGAMKEDLQDMARKAGRHIHDMADAAGNSATDVAGMACDKVRDKPLQSLGIAVGVGFIAGLLLRR